MRSIKILAPVVFAGLFLAGCRGTTPPSRFFTLDPSAAALGREEVSVPPLPFEAKIGIGPVQIPGYLSRPQIVQRTGANEIRYAPYVRWGEPLYKKIPMVLQENLSTLLPGAIIVPFPMAGGISLDYRVVVEFYEFDADAEGMVRLRARWYVYRPSDRSVLKMRLFSTSKKAEGGGYAAVAQAHSEALAEFSREVARAVRDLLGEEMPAPAETREGDATPPGTPAGREASGPADAD